MNELSKYMFNTFNMNKLGFDFMGYLYENPSSLTFHHLVLPHRYSGKLGYDKGYFLWNGALLTRSTAHDYLHLIEKIDPEVFYSLTLKMIEENINGKLDLGTLKEIRDLLLYFEKEHINDKKKKEPIIKPEYIEKRISLK